MHITPFLKNYILFRKLTVCSCAKHRDAYMPIQKGKSFVELGLIRMIIANVEGMSN